MSTINESIARLKTRHKEYLQSEYHIRHDRLIQERMDMLEDARGRTNVMADPFLEAPPKYNPHKTKFENMNLPDEVKAILTDFAEQKFGVYNPPYEHQAEAVEAVFNDEKDVIVVTGTGSGKTEVFTYSILGKAAQEGLKPSSDQYGVRTLVLYPMNALVSDQLTRIRKMFGLQTNETTGLNPQDILKKYRKHTKRPFRFAMYTGRTPYHGTYDDKSGGRNTKSIAPIMRYYGSIKDNALGKELEKLGRVPQKNLEAFWNKGKKKGKKFRTTPIDAEYLTRQEILDPANREIHGGGTPELLITNYSMLEYMLIRPIEQPIIEDTKKWLADNPTEKLLLVMDEAHLYRGSGGAEVALLLRRLMSRLGVGSDRLQFILTSASFSGEAKEFAASLTHKAKENWHKQGARPISYGEKLVTGNEAIARALVQVSNNFGGNSLVDVTQLNPLINTLNWSNPQPVTGDKKRDREEAMLYLGSKLNEWDLFRFFADEIGKNPKKLSDISMTIFPKLFFEDEDLVNEAVLQLGNLGTIAKLGSVDVPLLPTRLHLFFRGLPQHFVCVNHQCSERRAENGEFLGRIYLEPRLLCDCGSRTYQLDTCRDCGTAFLHTFVNKQSYRNFVAGSEPSCRTWNESFESGGVNLHIMPVPNEFSPKSQIYHLDKLTGTLHKQPNENTIKVLIGQSCSKSGKLEPEMVKKKDGWNGYTFQKCPRCLTQVNIGISARLKIQNLETSGEQPLSNIVSELFQSQPERNDIPDEIIRKVPNKGKKVLVFSDSRDKASRLASNLQNDVEFDSLRATFFKVLREQFDGSDKVLMSDAYFGFLWYCSNQNLRFFKGGQREQFNQSSSDLYDLLEVEGLIDTSMDENIDHIRNYSENKDFTASMLRIFGDNFYSMYNLLIGYLEPTDAFWSKLEKTTSGIDKDFVEIQSLVRYLLRYAAKERAIDPDVSKYVRDRSRRFPESKNKAQGLTTELSATRSFVNKELLEILQECYGWNEEELNLLITRLTRSLGDCLFVKITQDYCREEQQSSLNRYVVNPSVVCVKSDLDINNWTICKTCLEYNHISTSNDVYCFNCMNPSISKLDVEDLHVRTRPGFYRNEVERKFEKENHPYAIRTEEHTAQVNNRDTYSGDVFSPAEKYELEFQDVIMSEDSNRGRDQPVDLLSCTTTMEVGIDIGGLTAVGMRTVPPRPDNYQQRSGRAGRRGSTLSTIVTYANNSPHEQHYFMHPGEIIGAQPKDPLLQVDNARLAERHINAMLFQIYYTVINKIPQDNQSVFESIGLTEEFFDLVNPSTYNYSNFVKWVNSLNHGSATHRDICSLLPNKLANRLPFGSDPDWREKFVDKTIKLLLNRLKHEANFYTEYMRKKRASGDTEIDQDNRLLDYLLRNSYLPSFAFPIDVCNFSILEWDMTKSGIKEKYSPSASVSQALAMYVPGKELHINKEKYQSAGIYVPFPDSLENRFAGEIDKVEYHVMVCDECNSLSTFDKTHEIYSQVDCKNCGAKDRHTFPMYKPKAFAPLSNGNKSIEVRDRIDQVNQRKSSVLLPLTTMMNPADMTDRLHNSKIIFKREEELFQLNTGPKSDDTGLETEQDAGWEICGQCGTCRDVLKNKNATSHDRVYPRISHGPNKFNSIRCEANDWQRLILGYNFQTDMMLLQTELDPEIINFARILEVNSPIEQAALSAKEGLLAAITRGSIHSLDMDDGEINGHYRILHDVDGTGKTNLEFYLFDTAPGGAGYSEQVMHSIEDVIDEAIDLMEDCECETSCHYCLRNYMNKFEHTKLNRRWGASLLRYLRDGEIPKISAEFGSSMLDKILKPNLEAEEGVNSVSIEINSNDKSLIDVSIETNEQRKTFQTSVRSSLENNHSPTGVFDIEDYSLTKDMYGIIERFKQRF